MKRTTTLLSIGVAAAGALALPSLAGAAGVGATVSEGTLRITGTSGADAITVRLRAGDPITVEVDAGADGTADHSFPRDQFTSILVLGRSGADTLRIDDVNGTFSDTELTTLEGGSGDDLLLGGGGAELLNGGSGADAADGNRGNDTGVMGSGNDAFTWDPGDGNDIIEGESGRDTMIFNGAGGSETFDMSANGGRLRFFRVPGNVLMDTDSVEAVDVNALGNVDVFTIADLSATDVAITRLDLGPAIGAVGGDGAADQVLLRATDGDDTIAVSGTPAAVTVSGLTPEVTIVDGEPSDELRIDTLAGDDTVDTAALVPGVITLFVDGAPA